MPYEEECLSSRSAVRPGEIRVSPQVMDLRQLTDRVQKLQAQVAELNQLLAGQKENIQGHEELLGRIGAYDLGDLMDSD